MNYKMKSKRVLLGLSQEDLAKQIGVSRQTIILIEKESYNPSLKLCVAICKALNTTLDELFWEEEEKMKDERLMKEMNQIKGQVSLYVSVATLVLGLIKFFIYGFDFSFFYVEIFILAVTSIMFIVVLMNKTGTYDERTDQNIKTIYQYGFIVLLLGGTLDTFLSSLC